MIALALVAALLVMGASAITVAYRRQWHVQLRQQIRELPEHAGEPLRR